MRSLRCSSCAALALGLAGCAAPAAERGSAVPPEGGASVPAPATAAPAEPGTEGSASAAPPGPVSPGVPPPAPGSPAANALPPGPPEHHGPPLPELTVKSFGLHIGGTARDAAARDDFLRALEAPSWRYLDCYRLIDEPGSVGTFGADLTVGGRGGRPRVGKPRTKLPGDAFHDCMVQAFESVTFPATPSGRAVVVSYSVKFNLSD